VHSWGLVTYAYNPSYSGGRDPDSSSKPAWANSSQDLSQKNPSQKKKKKEAGEVTQGHKFKPQYHKKSKYMHTKCAHKSAP
jgi:hypothetical protein